jgi:hypothetical protein
VIAVRLLKRSVLGVSAVVSLAVSWGAPAVFAQSPWWHLDSGSRPASLQPGSGRDEVQELKVRATGGEVLLFEPVSSGFAVFPYDAKHEVVQTALEGIYGAGSVEVSGGPGDATGSNPYVVTFKGARGSQRVPLMNTESSGQACTVGAGECLKGEASATEVTVGKPDGELVVTAANLGDASVNGEASPVRILDKLPTGLRAVSIEAAASASGQNSKLSECSVESPQSAACTFRAALAPYRQIEAVIGVVVEKGASSDEVNEISASGGEAPAASIRRPISVSEPVSFGVEDYELTPEEEGGALDTQAGSHPFQLTTTIALNQTAEADPVALGKDLNFKLPAGLIGNPTPFPRCTLAQFFAASGTTCPPQTALGVAIVTAHEPIALGVTTFTVPVFNLEPSVGEPARFGFTPVSPVLLDTSVRTGGDYGVTVSVDNITQTAAYLSSILTFWGVPGDPRHDNSRGFGCLLGGVSGSCKSVEEHDPPPFLALPTSCETAMLTSVEADSWKQAGVFGSFPASQPMGFLDGCNRLPFGPSIKVTPDGQAGSTPTGLTVDEHVPQEVDLNATGLSESAVKGLSVTLPEGVGLNPAGADGLQACSMEEIGLQSPEATSCPEASKVATVKIKTPLLPNALEGAAYLATQDTNPFGSLVALYLYAEDPVSGVRTKATGEVLENPVTGQLTAHFEGDPLFQKDPAFAGEPETQFLPEVPFEDVEVHFFGGDRAPLGTPARCGGYTTTGTFTPWSGNPTSESSSEFKIVSGPNGAPCPGARLPFSPSLTTGTTSIQAGGFSQFTMTMSREDGEQDLQGVQLHMPLGLSGTLSAVKLCGEEQADAGTCGPESLIGETIVSVGLGGDPYTVKGGKVYITGPYRGAPFGLSIVNPAKAGPFDLGSVVVRAKLEVNEETAAITVTTDDEGPYKIPTIIDGIPLQIKHVNVSINRPGFMFNATNCNPLQITGDLVSTEGATSTLQVPYQVTNCAVLAFKPKLEASTSGKTSRADGASLHVRLGYPAGPYDANIAKVKVELPKALPSRLTTLQKACSAAVFDSNPAACPPASIVGHATAVTPELPVPLTGPAYFVSHGGEAFPSLIIVLQGYGVTVHLVGSTFIDKAGITSSTFKTVPDAPVGSFELTLPEGQFSALAANGNLCKQKLAMPTEFIGQNGALIKTSTKIAVTGCPKHKAKKARKHAKTKRKARKKKR